MNAIVPCALWFQINLNELLFFCVLYFLLCYIFASMHRYGKHDQKNLETQMKTETLI